jgi:hypothetical protein
MAEKESLYVKKRFIQNIFFANKTMQGFDGEYPSFRVDGEYPSCYIFIKGLIILKRGNDTIQEKIEQENSDFSVIMSIVQFYIIKHNYQFDCWIKLKVY